MDYIYFRGHEFLEMLACVVDFLSLLSIKFFAAVPIQKRLLDKPQLYKNNNSFTFVQPLPNIPPFKRKVTWGTSLGV